MKEPARIALSAGTVTVAIFGGLFPDARIEGMRLIAFKIYSEDVIVHILQDHSTCG